MSFIRKSDNMVLFNGKYTETVLIHIAITVYIFLSLSSLLYSGYYADDIANSLIKANIEANGISSYDYSISLIKHFAENQGRFIPISIFSMVYVHYFFSSTFAYKCVLLFSVVINVYLYGYLIRIITDNKYISFIMMLAIPVFYQFRLYHDPILSYSGMLQFLFAYISLSLISLSQYLKYDNKLYLTASLIFYNLVLYSYELGYIIIIIHVGLILYSKFDLKVATYKILPFALSLFIAISISIYIRKFIRVNETGYAGIAINLDVKLIIKTFVYQLYSALPFSYYFSNPANIFNPSNLSKTMHCNYNSILAISIFIIMYWYCRKKLNLLFGGSKLILLGLGFWILPAIMIALSSKYQQEFGWYGGFGIGYLPVYLQYYGVLMILTGLLIKINKMLANKYMITAFKILTLIIICMCININIINNTTIVDKYNIDLYFRRLALEKALYNGILSNIKENSTILVFDNYIYDPFPSSVFDGLKNWSDSYNWKNSYFIYLHTKRKYQVISNKSQLKQFNSYNINNNITHPDDLYLIIIKSYPDSMDKNEGYVMFAKANTLPENISSMDEISTLAAIWQIY